MHVLYGLHLKACYSLALLGLRAKKKAPDNNWTPEIDTPPQVVVEFFAYNVQAC